MSYHSGRISPKSSEPLPEEDTKASGRRTPSQASRPAAKDQKLSGLTRAVQNLLGTPQSARSAGTGLGRSVSTSRRRGTRSPVQPFASSPLRISSSAMASAPSSPERPKAGEEDLSRRSSDQFTQETDRRASTGQGLGLEEDSKSDLGSNAAEQGSSKKSKAQGRSAMAAMMSGLESRLFPKSFTRGRDSSRGSSRRGSSLDSRSPSSSSRFTRSISPGSQLHSGSKSTSTSTERVNQLTMEDTRNKSDEALVKRAGGLPDYVKPAAQEDSGERLAKDVFDRDQNMIESSDDDGDDSLSEEEHIPGVTVVHARGRKNKSSDISSITPSDFSKSKHDKTADEKKPDSKASSEKKPRKSAMKAVIHPQTSYDIPTPRTQSAAGTPYGSEDEAERDDIHRAQQLGISMSAIDNLVPNRSIRTVIRGDFASLQEEADNGRRRQRKYLIAIDLSEESVYALEWTIGAILRDGDTMFAIYAVHEDTNTSSVQVGEGAKVMRDATAVVGSQTKEATQNPGRTILGRLGPGSSSKSSSVDARASSMAEAERVKAVETISDTCVKLLRKTLLQVRIAVEVIHCKNPRTLVTEAIDELEPTLVIVGARGQSAFKGVLLGSFSNYLLSNSSVPVMVARRKLKRHPSKGRLSNIRLTNNLKAPKSLTQAKVD
ncbi:uncharacterized protein N7459_001069 [Penicillium hispanicum]|uniref:uncharacterized protein n=1 Tax=Penicillium hispanicum TaxID=1080232 RepID=UPI00254128DE|nr:uncharacterized protein N7459_001069 [Penicillium hispanicum]KAJ5594861.1 hypothetical protein N7459_001069 [Penicillium hispanicum]